MRMEIAVPHGVEGFTATLGCRRQRIVSLAATSLPARTSGRRIARHTTDPPRLRVLPSTGRRSRPTARASGIHRTRDHDRLERWQKIRRRRRQYNESSVMRAFSLHHLNFSSARPGHRATERQAGICAASGWGMGEAMVLAVPTMVSTGSQAPSWKPREQRNHRRSGGTARDLESQAAGAVPSDRRRQRRNLRAGGQHRDLRTRHQDEEGLYRAR